MKKLYSFMAIVGIIFLSNCTQIEENNDPVLGIWKDTSSKLVEGSKQQNIQMEWIFNDAYLGRYHEIVNGTITVKNDFQWSIKDGKYTIKYPNLDKPNDTATLVENPEGDVLMHTDGHIIAVRE